MAATTVQPIRSLQSERAQPATKTERTVTVLLTTFAGLGLPRTLALPLTTANSIQDVIEAIYAHLPPVEQPLVITTTNNKQLLFSNTHPISTLLADSDAAFLPLRLSTRLCGGKGGFGSQLRAAGGRMSSRKKRDQNQNQNGSSRNLDGHRLNSVTKAKQLGDLLVKQEEFNQTAGPEKRQALAEQIKKLEETVDQIESGKLGGDKGRLDAEYVESKEQAQIKTTESLVKSLREGTLQLERLGGDNAMDVDNIDGKKQASPDDEGSESSERSTKEEQEESKSLWGFEPEEDTEDDEEAEPDTAPEPETDDKV